MYKPHGWVRTPINPNVSIFRYFKYERFVDLLERRQLHFARLDQFADPFEGVLPTATVPLAKDRFRQGPATPGDGMNDWVEYVRWYNRFGKCCDFANCWYTSEYESDAMWRLYAAEGIAVRSTVGRLCESVANEPEPVHVGEMWYCDFRTEQPPTTGNLLPGAYLKRREFQHERELRAVVIKKPSGWRGDQACPDSQTKGMKIAVDLDTLIERVYVAPRQPESLRQDVRQAMERHGLDKPIASSFLDERPVLI